MTTAPVYTNATAPVSVQQPVPIGSLVYMASYLLKLTLNAEVTPPDTPNMYSGQLEVQGDAGQMSKDALVGPQGFPGKAHFAFRRQRTPVVNSVGNLPTNLTDTTTDIGKYWEIATIEDGVITEVWSYVWYGTGWRRFQMGTYGPPGPTPQVTPSVELISPQALPSYPDHTSYVETDGTSLEPTWIFDLAVPAGASGPISPMASFPDVDETALQTADILAASGNYNAEGQMIWKPLSMSMFATQFYSVPQSAFLSYPASGTTLLSIGASQQAPVGAFALPPQPFPWTPLVWGHMGEGGISLPGSVLDVLTGQTIYPFKIGAQVLLGNQNTGVQIGRGFGTTSGEVNIYPHYSTLTAKGANISPVNNYAVVPANHTGDEGTIFFNLWNDGSYGLYHFDPINAQIMVLVMPIEQGRPITPF